MSPLAPLAGLTVLDFTLLLPGPYCTRLLADLGARVVKVEPPWRDGVYARPPLLPDGAGASYTALNHGKDVVTLDLRSDEGRSVAVELARGALQAGESAPAVLNAANEVAVAAFLAGRAPFPAIVETVEKVLAAHRPAALASLDDALAWDAWGRERAAEVLGS